MRTTTNRIAVIVSVLTFVLAQGFVSSTAFATQPDANGEHKVTICHRTASYTNPYVQITVDKASVDGVDGKGKGDHALEHQGPVFNANLPKHTEWGDIIPEGQGVKAMNWNNEGQAIYNNGCKVAKAEKVENTQPAKDVKASETVKVTPVTKADEGKISTEAASTVRPVGGKGEAATPEALAATGMGLSSFGIMSALSAAAYGITRLVRK